MPETAKRTARVPILGEDGRISDDYVPAAIGEGVEAAEAAAKRAETAATDAKGSANAAGTSATKAQESASAAGNAKAAADTAQKGAESAKTAAEAAKAAAEKAKTDAESARGSAQTAASQAKQSATAAEDSAASVADKFIASAQATTLEPGSQATASVADQVLTLGIPRGDKGDKGDQGEKGDTGTGVPDGGTPGQLLSKTADGTAWVDPPSGNVLTGEAEGYVAHAEDAYAQKPIETRIKGKTWVNRWPVINNTSNGIMVATDETGLVTVTGTATADADVTADVSGWATGKSYTVKISATPTGCSAYFEVQKPSGNTSINATTAGATLNVASDATNCVAGVHVTSGTTVNASFRVMLVDGTEASDCFTPCASITSAQPENLVTSGKNLLPSTEITKLTEVNAYAAYDGMLLHPGSYTITCDSVDKPAGIYVRRASDNSVITANELSLQTPTFSFTLAYTEKVRFEWFFAAGDTKANGVSNPMLELGSTATAYEPPNVTTTPLPEVELRSLPNGTCDELVIRADGTCEVERKIVQVTFDGSEDELYGWYVTGNKPYIRMEKSSNVSSYSDSENKLFCDKLPVISGGWDSDVINASISSLQPSRLYVGPIDGVASDNYDTEFRSWLQANPITVVYGVSGESEPQSSVTLPALPAPTFNQYHDSPVPSDTSTEYVRDINIVLDNLAKQVAGTASAVAVREASTIEKE